MPDNQSRYLHDWNKLLIFLDSDDGNNVITVNENENLKWFCWLVGVSKILMH
jgi:hypothetical protein